MLFALTLLLIIDLEPSLIRRLASPQDSSRSTQSSTERESLLREAIKNRYTVRRVAFAGNELTRDNVLRRRIFLQEGDVFTRHNLQRSIASLNRLNIIYPATFNDVWVDLDRTDKLIDLTIRVRERPSRAKRAS
jgi:hypothetical protein